MKRLLKGVLVNLRPIEFTDTSLIVRWRNNPISLCVLSGNDQAFRSYENAGFRKEGMARGMAFLDGAYQSVILMTFLAE